MAGTPTPNYQFPTYAETDTPNLAGAYNQAVNAIDAKIKEVADSVSSGGDVPDANSTTKGIAKLYDSTTVGAGNQDDGGVTPNAVTTKVNAALENFAPKFTAATPITYSGNQIGIRYSNPAADGAQNGYGAVQVTGKQSDVASADSLTTATVPNVKAVKDYVDAKVPTEQQAYTGTAPITVDTGSRAIGITPARQLVDGNVTAFISAIQEDAGNASDYGGSSYAIVEGANNANTIFANHDVEHNWPAAFCVPNLNTVMGLVLGTFKGIDPIVIDSGAKTVSARLCGVSQYDAENGFTVGNAGTIPYGRIINLEVYNAMITDTDAANRTQVTGSVPSVLLMSQVIAQELTQDRQSNLANATTPLTTEMLANLYVNPTTGSVFYKAPTE